MVVINIHCFYVEDVHQVKAENQSCNDEKREVSGNEYPTNGGNCGGIPSINEGLIQLAISLTRHFNRHSVALGTEAIHELLLISG